MIEEKLLFLEKMLGKSKFSNNTKEAQFICPFCNHYKQKLYINLESDRWHCFRCNKAGVDLYYIIKKVGTKEDLDEYNSAYKSSVVELKNIEEFEKIGLPREYISLVDNNSFAANRIKKYLLEIRKINEEDILYYKIGTALSGQYNQRVIFPSFDKKGFVNFFNCRNIDKKGMYSMPQVQKGYRNSIIINEINLDFSKPILLVEGWFDLFKTGLRNVSPLLGSFLSKDSELFKTIVKNKTQVILGLDPDAEQKALDIADKFISYDVNVFMIDIGEYKDIGEMNSEEFKIRYNNRFELSELYVMRRKMRFIK